VAGAEGKEGAERKLVEKKGLAQRMTTLEDNVEGLQAKLDQVLALLQSAVQEVDTTDDEAEDEHRTSG